MDLNDYIPALRYGATIPTDANDITLTSGSIIVGDSSNQGTGVPMKGQANIDNAGSVQLKLANGKVYIGDSGGQAQAVTPSGALTVSTTGVFTAYHGVPFITTTSVGTAATVAGVTLLADGSVTAIGATKKVYLEGFVVTSSAVAWTNSTGAGIPVQLQDNAGTVFCAAPSSGSSFLAASESMLISGGSVTFSAPFNAGTGGTAGRGLRLKLISGGSITTGQTAEFTVWGMIK